MKITLTLAAIILIVTTSMGAPIVLDLFGLEGAWRFAGAFAYGIFNGACIGSLLGPALRNKK